MSEETKEALQAIAWTIFVSLAVWAMHMQWAAERAQMHRPHSPMLLCEVGC